MFAQDFIFNEQRLSDFGLIIANLDGDNNSSSGGDIEYNAVKTPSRDKFTYYGGQFNTVLEWNFTVIKNPCLNSEFTPFTQYEESMIARWLLTPKSGYHWLQFDQDMYQDIWYDAVFQMTPHYVNGKTYGYDLTATSNCGYGWSEEKVKTKTLSSSNPALLTIHSDVETYVLPKITISDASGAFYISNESDVEQNKAINKETSFSGIRNDIIMDSDNAIIDGLKKPSDFNYYYPRLVNGTNKFVTNSDSEITLKFEYREPRRVIV